MFPGINKRKMEQVMRQMGMSQENIDATEVIIRCPDKEIVISNPQVAKINMMGQDSFQITGKYEERALSSAPEISEDDIKTVAEQANCSEEDAKAAIEEANGDLAAAILKLKS